MKKIEEKTGYQMGIAFLRILEYLHEQGNPQPTKRSIRIMPLRIKLYLEEEYGIAISREKVRDMLDAICESKIRYNLICDQSGKQRAYRYEPEFTLEEVSFLTDMVSSSMFLEKTEMERMLAKLCVLTSSQNYPYLSNADHYYRPPMRNPAALGNLRLIHRAINNQEVLQFYTGAIDESKHLYFETALSRNPKQVKRVYPIQPGIQIPYHILLPKINEKHGLRKVCSPYALVWDNSRCYLICGLHSDGRILLWNYRVDRMFLLQVNEKEQFCEPRTSFFYDAKSKKVLIEDYLHTSFKMFVNNRSPVPITLRFKTLHTRVIVEKFGYDVKIEPQENGYASVKVPVQISQQFYAWLAGFLPEDLRMTAPEKAVLDYMNYLQQILKAITPVKQ